MWEIFTGHISSTDESDAGRIPDPRPASKINYVTDGWGNLHLMPTYSAVFVVKTVERKRSQLRLTATAPAITFGFGFGFTGVFPQDHSELRTNLPKKNLMYIAGA